MRIYLMRHAEAVEAADWDGPDQTRPLSAIGNARLSEAIEHMRRLKMTADKVLTSPILRATQTADAITEGLHILQSHRCPELSSGARYEAFQALLRNHVDAASVWVVAHMPEIAVFASRLTDDRKTLEQAFRPGEVVAADCEVTRQSVGRGRLVWRRRLDDWAEASA